MNILSYFVSRLREPSSWAGMAAMAMLFGVPASTAHIVVEAIGGVAAAAAIFLPSPNGKASAPATGDSNG